MTSSPQQPSPSPFRFFEAVNAYQHTAVIKSAIELKVFSIIARHSKANAAAIAKDAGAAERGIRILCDYLASDGLLVKQNGEYSLTPDSAMFLDENSQAYVGGAIRFLLSPHITKPFDVLTESVRKGGTALPAEGAIAAEHPQWIDFARSMAPMMFPAAEGIAKLLTPTLPKDAKVLDIAAGHGIFGVLLAQIHGNARIVALDWGPVLQVAAENAKKFGVADRHTLLQGSAFEVEYGGGYDAVLITNFLHHFDFETNVKIMKKVYAALKPGGVAAILEFVPNDDKVTPPDPARFSIIMLSNTPAGEAFSESELWKMSQQAGFTSYSAHPLPPIPQTVILVKK